MPKISCKRCTPHFLNLGYAIVKSYTCCTGLAHGCQWNGLYMPDKESSLALAIPSPQCEMDDKLDAHACLSLETEYGNCRLHTLGSQYPLLHLWLVGVNGTLACISLLMVSVPIPLSELAASYQQRVIPHDIENWGHQDTLTYCCEATQQTIGAEISGKGCPCMT